MLESKNVVEVLSTIYEENIIIEDSIQYSGGSINQTQVLKLSNKEQVFIKTNPSPPIGFFEKEAKGLDLLRSASDGPRIPKVLGVGHGDNPQFILLEFLENTQSNYYQNLGKSLAALHSVSNKFYGLDHDNFIGKTLQINTPESNGVIFFRDHRIGFQQDLAYKNKLLPLELNRKIDEIKKI